MKLVLDELETIVVKIKAVELAVKGSSADNNEKSAIYNMLDELKEQVEEICENAKRRM